MPTTSQTRAYVALLLMTLLWGSYPSTAKLALRDFPPFFLAMVRCSIGAVFLSVLLARSGAEAVRGLGPGAVRAFIVLALAGIVGSTQITYVAIYYTTAANAVILQCATPVLVAVGARFYLGERLRRRQWIGVVASALGVLLIITNGRLAALDPQELRAGDFLTLLSLGSWTAYTVYGKRVLASYPPALATTAAYVIGTVFLIPITLVSLPFFPAPRVASAPAWLVVFYHAIPGAVAHVWWYKAVEVVGASRSAIFMNFQPLIGVGLAAALLGELITPWQIGGGILVLAGVALTTTRTVSASDEPTTTDARER